MCFESRDPTKQRHPAEPDGEEEDEAVREPPRSRHKKKADHRENNCCRSDNHPREAKYEYQQKPQDANQNWGWN
jgi:hypothetical protein